MSRPNPLLAGVAGRCPKCGEGFLSDRLLKIARAWVLASETRRDG